MQRQLEDVLLSFAVTPENLATIKAADPSLHSISDLVGGAANEVDARVWADELGVDGRVQKARFVQVWKNCRDAAFSNPASPARSLPSPERHGLNAAFASTPEKDGRSDGRARGFSSRLVELAHSDVEANTSIFQGRKWEPRDEARAEARAAEALASVAVSPGRHLSPEEMLEARFAAEAAMRTTARPRARSVGGRARAGQGSGYGQASEKAAEPQRVARGYLELPEEETFTTEGGMSDFLRLVLKANKVTAMEIRDLDRKLEFRSCRELAAGADTLQQAQNVARRSGVNAKASQENFAFAWRECYRMVYAPRIVYTMSAKFARGDFEGCAQHLLKRMGTTEKQELVPALLGLLTKIADAKLANSKRARELEEMSVMARLYGEEDKARRQKQVHEAEWRWRWTVRGLMSPKFAVVMQKRLLVDYRAEHFRAACSVLNEQWLRRKLTPSLEEKMSCIEKLCFDSVLKHILPTFGFAGDSGGLQEMKAAMNQHLGKVPEVRQNQYDISAVIMSNFKL